MTLLKRLLKIFETFVVPLYTMESGDLSKFDVMGSRFSGREASRVSWNNGFENRLVSLFE